MNIMRQSLAMVIVLCSYDSLRKKSLLKFIGTIILAACFHKSSLIFLLAWCVHYIKLGKRFLLLVVCMCGCTYLFSSELLSLAFNNNLIPSYYLDTGYLDGGKIAPFINFTIYTSIFLFVYFSKSYMKVTDTSINDNYFMFLILSFGIILSVVNLKFAAFNRISSYFTMFSVVLLPNSLCTITKKNKYVFYSSVIFIAFTLYYFVVITLRPYWIYVYPYEFFF